MLDQDSVLEPQLAGKAANVEGSIRHISHDDLDAYANGRLAAARMDNCATHLDACEACRAELEDIRTLQTELSAFTPKDSKRREAERRQRRRNLALPLTAAAVVVVVAAGSAVLWWRHGSARVYNTSSVAPVARSEVAPAAPVAPVARLSTPPAVPVARAAASLTAPVARNVVPSVASVTRSTVPPNATVAHYSAPTTTPVVRSLAPQPVSVARSSANPPATGAATIQTRDTRLAEEIAALPEDLRAVVSEAIQQGRVQLPADVRRTHDRAPTSSAPSEANTGFSLLGPFGEATSETRPKFNWQPLPGAIGYTVAIVDQGLRPVQHSPALRATTWHPRRPLARGHTYLWQVTATMHGGSKIVASSPAPSEALLRIIPRKLADQMARFQRGHRDAHLVLGVVYAQAGMLTEGADELRKVPAGDSSYDVARRLLQSFSSGR
jgi:hypothetical protein